MLFCARTPDRRRVVIGVLVGAVHPLQAAQLLVRVDLVVVLDSVLLLFFLLFVLSGCSAFAAYSSLGRLLALLHLLVALCRARVLLSKFLRGAMAANVSNCLQLLLLGQLFSLLFLLLQLEAFGRSLKLSLVHYEEVARSSLGKVWLREDVLDAGDGADFAFLVDILELMHLIGLVDDAIALLKVN